MRLFRMIAGPLSLPCPNRPAALHVRGKKLLTDPRWRTNGPDSVRTKRPHAEPRVGPGFGRPAERYNARHDEAGGERAMMTEQSVSGWIDQLREGDSEAANQLWQRTT